jgi:four helix bundle protein
MHNFEQLDVYNKALDFVDHAYRAIEGFPREELFSLADQFKRAATSIALNIAEGSGRSRKEFAHFLTVARSSAYECSAIAEIARRRTYVNEAEFKELYCELVIIIKMLNKLRQSICEL